MQFYHIAGDFSQYTPLTDLIFQAGAPVWDTAATTKRQPNNSRGSFLMRDNSYEAQSSTWSNSVAEFWFHTVLYINGNGTTNVEMIKFISVANSSNAQLQLIKTATSATYQWQYWNGSAWTNVGSTFTLANATLHRVDIHVKFHASAGAIDVYVNESSVLAYSGALTSQNSVCDAVRLNGPATSGADTYWSEVFVADSQTTGYEIVEIYPNATGTTNQWTGAFGDVDDVFADNTDFMVCATPGDFFTFNAPAVPTGPDAKSVAMVAHFTFGMVDKEGGPTDMRAVIRSGGVEHQSSDLGFASTDGYATKIALYDTNPGTGTYWTIANINAMEIGVKAVA